MAGQLPSLESQFFAEGATWSLVVNSYSMGRGVSLSRERKLIAQIAPPEWASLEGLIWQSPHREDLDRVARVTVGILVSGAPIVPAEVRDRLADLLARHAERTVGRAAA